LGILLEIGVEYRVLIVTSDRDTCETLTEALAHYHVLAAFRKGDALFQFDVAHPDLIILDLSTPCQDGWEILRRFRQLTPVPIIVLGCALDSQAEIRSLDQGADYFVLKPVGPRELAARVRALLRRAGVVKSSASLPANGWAVSPLSSKLTTT
jgi:DNA-binding response OmpR family regulator